MASSSSGGGWDATGLRASHRQAGLQGKPDHVSGTVGMGSWEVEMAKKRPGRGAGKSRGAKARSVRKREDSVGELLDMNQAVKLLGTSRPTFYRWLRTGKIKGMKLGRQWRFYREDIERFLRGQGPRIDLPADMTPLMRALSERVKKLGVAGASAADADEVTRVVNLMVAAGAGMKASDMHIHPHMKEDGQGTVALLRCRVDGVLRSIAEIDIRLLPAIAEQWKRMAGCNIHEKTSPQDGRIMLKFEGRILDLRVSFMSAVLGESVTVRILDPKVIMPLTLDRIDYAEEDKAKLYRALDAAWGMMVVCGPAGCGKTTVLYGCVNHVAGPERKVVTIEDPVEVLLPWVVQTAIRPGAGVTYTRALRATLRGDPDVVMIGEVRDTETLRMAMHCALTGHLVLTTMHAGDAAAALRRMLDLGAEPHLIAEAVKLVIGQRLVRKLCVDCSQPADPHVSRLDRAEELARSGGLKWEGLDKGFRGPAGCSKCNETGFRGRNVIAEALAMTHAIGVALGRGASAEELRGIAVAEGMTTLAADGVRRAAAGVTSLDEVMRVLGGC